MDNANTTTGETVCGRCAGAKFFRCFAHVEGGVCYECRGRGYLRAGETKGTKATQSADRANRVRGWYRQARTGQDAHLVSDLPFRIVRAEIRAVPGALAAFSALSPVWASILQEVA